MPVVSSSTLLQRRRMPVVSSGTLVHKRGMPEVGWKAVSNVLLVWCYFPQIKKMKENKPVIPEIADVINIL